MRNAITRNRFPLIIILLLTGLLASMLAVGRAQAAEDNNNGLMDFRWTPPTTTEGGMPLTDLAGHKIFCNGVEVADVGPAPTFPVQIPPPEPVAQDCQVLAYDTAGHPSEPSNTVTWTPATIPSAPADFTVEVRVIVEVIQ